MSPQNASLKKYLKYYLDLKNPGYAVLIRGAWGSGKTWLIKAIIEELKEEKRFIYVSTYGVTSPSEIDALIFQQLHPILASRPVSLLSNALQGAFKIGFSFVPEGSEEQKGKASGSYAIGNLAKFTEELLKNQVNRSIIFDDIERARMDVSALMGYINSFVEHKGLNVIVISNVSADFFKNTEEFAKTQEKIIGAQFAVQPEFDSAMETFIAEMKPAEQAIYTLEVRQLITQVFDKLAYGNLRALKQAMQSFNYFLDFFSEETLSFLKNRHESFFSEKSEQNNFQNMVEAFYYFSLEQSAGYLKSEQYEFGLGLFRTLGLNFRDFEGKTAEEKEKIQKEHRHMEISGFTVLHKQWQKIITNDPSVEGMISDFSTDIKREFENKSAPIWSFIHNFPEIKAAELKILCQKIYRQINVGEFERPGEFLHAAGILFYLSHKGIIPRSIEKIEATLVAKLKSQQFMLNSRHIKIDEHHGGHAFWGGELKEFKKFSKILDDFLIKKHREKIATEINNEVAMLPQNMRTFWRELIHINYGGKYAYIPALSYLRSPKKIYKQFAAFSREELRTILYAFKERYELRYDNGKVKPEYYPEKIFIAGLHEYFQKKIATSVRLFNLEQIKYSYCVEELAKILLQFDKASTS